MFVLSHCNEFLFAILAARDLIRKMLDQSDETRITCQQILNHDWVRDGSLATVKNEEAANEIAPDAAASTKVGNETSGASIIESSASIQARIPRVNDVTDNEDDPEEGLYFFVLHSLLLECFPDATIYQLWA